MSSPSAARFKPFAKGAFCQHWHCQFTVDGQEFTTALQYMLYQKACFLGKHEIAKKIQQATAIKDYQRQSATIVSSEDDEKKWKGALRDVVKKANTAKFQQNDSMKKELLATAGSVLVYADPRDNLLGVGLKEHDHEVRDKSKWRGQNILGEVLMEIRDEMLAKGEHGEPPKQWQVGDECMSPWSQDNKLYKAVIEKIDEANQSCIVKYDYDGATEPRDLSVLSPAKADRRGQKRQQSSGGGGGYRNQRSREDWDTDESNRFEADGGEGSDEKYTFFWQAQSPFSQWYVSKFEVDGVHYNCAEQFMMHQKALTFQDLQKATEIMDARRPVHQKELGRQVAGYDEEKWNAVCKEIVKKGNMAKFTQNRELLDELLATAGTVLAEASPVDRKWGIGLAADDSRAKRRRTWRGENLLGQCLTEVRDEILEKIKDGSFVMPEILSDVVEAPEGYTLFWRSQSPFSQWYSAWFTKDDVTYNCAEQYMMYQKALFFDDLDAARRILRETDPPKQKQIARGVKNFDETEWNKVSRGVVKDGSREKYTQNDDLRRELFATANTVLVEASKDDTRWGIGSTKDDPISWNRRTWRGENWLGQILTEVRDELMQKEWPHPGSLSPRNHAGISYRAFSLPQSPFHLFHPCTIVVEGRTFSSAGQWLLYTRAGFARNPKLAEEILNPENTERLSAIDKQLVFPAEQQQAWESDLRKKLHTIITLKLDQNADIKRKLVETGSDYLVFAAAEPPLGTSYRRNIDDNWLGKMLMQIRDKLIESTHFYGSRTRNHFQRTAPDEHRDLPPSEKISSSNQKSLADHVSQALEHKGPEPSRQAAARQATPPSKVQNEGWAPKNPAQSSTGYKQQAKSGTQQTKNKNQPEPTTKKQADIVFFNNESPFHLWYPVSVTVDDVEYSCAGQCLLHLAAENFGDAELASKILVKAHESDYLSFEKTCKGFAIYDWRDALGDDDKLLDQVNFEKFHRNRDLAVQLTQTRDGTIVFASKDRLLGTGCSPDDVTVSKPINWRGKNYLGRSLMKVREKLAAEFQPEPEPEISQPTPHANDSGRQQAFQEHDSEEVIDAKSKKKKGRGGGKKNENDDDDGFKDGNKGSRNKKGKAVPVPVSETSRDRSTVNHSGKASEKVDDVSKVPEESQAAVEKCNQEVGVEKLSEADKCQEETATSRSDILQQTADTSDAVAAADRSDTGESSDVDKVQMVPEPCHPAEDLSAEKSDAKERSDISDGGNAQKSEVETSQASSPLKQTGENESSNVEPPLLENKESGVPCESVPHPDVPSPTGDAGSPVSEGTCETVAPSSGGGEEPTVTQSQPTTDVVADQNSAKTSGGEEVASSLSEAVPSPTDEDQPTEMLQKAATVQAPETALGMATPVSEAVAEQQENLTEEAKEKSCPETTDHITTKDPVQSPEQTSGDLAPPQREESETAAPVTAEANGTEVEMPDEKKPRDTDLPDAAPEDVSSAGQTSECVAVSDDAAARTSFAPEADQEKSSSAGTELKLSDKSDKPTIKDGMSEKSTGNVAVDLESETEKSSSSVPAVESDDAASSTPNSGFPSTISNDGSGIESHDDTGVPAGKVESRSEMNDTPISTNNDLHDADSDNSRDESPTGENAPGIGSSAGTTDAVKSDPEKESVVTNGDHSTPCETENVDPQKAGSGDATPDSSKPNSSDLASKPPASGDEINP